MSESLPDIPVAAPAGRSIGPLAARSGLILVRLAGDALLIDAAYETWRSDSPLRLIVVAAVAVFALLTLWVLSQGGRIGGRGWLTDPAAPYILLIGIFIAATGSRGDIAHGPVMFGQPTDVALVGSLLVLVAMGVLRFSGPGGVRTRWLRLAVAAVGVYAGWSLVLALMARTGAVAVLAGDCEWRSVPAWARGGEVGAFVVVPLAFVHEFTDAMTRLTLVGLLRWLVIFALGSWLAIRVACV